MYQAELFCPVPWLHQSVRNNGDYRICSQSGSPLQGLLRDKEGRVMNVRTHSPEETRNCGLLRQTRIDILDGKWPLSCQRCRKEEALGLRSRRSYEVGMAEGVLTRAQARELTGPMGTFDPKQVPLRSMDLRLGNHCVLKCRMCGPESSSSWAFDHPLSEEAAEQMQWPLLPENWDRLRSCLPSLRHMHLDGGEPLAIHAHTSFLEKIVDSGFSKNITLQYNTSLAVLPDKVLQLWSHFEKVRVGISIDGIGKFNDYIRYPSAWSDIEANLVRINQAEGNFELWIATTVQIYNILHLPELFRWFSQSGLSRFQELAPARILAGRTLQNPKRLSLRAMPESLKDHVEQSLRKSVEDFGPHKEELKNIFEAFIRFMRDADDSELWPDFLDYTRKMDQRRRQDFFDLYPELIEMSCFSPLKNSNRPS